MAIPKKYAAAKKKATKKKVARKRNPAKKKRSAKQIAATKRLVASNKKRRKNPDTKKKVAKKKVAKKKTVRKTNPAKRRAPRKWRVLCVVPSVAGIKSGLKENETGYWTGSGWDTRKSKAVRFPDVEAARNAAANLPAKHRSGRNWSYATEVV